MNHGNWNIKHNAFLAQRLTKEKKILKIGNNNKKKNEKKFIRLADTCYFIIFLEN